MASPGEHPIEYYRQPHEEQPGLIPGSPPPHPTYEPKMNTEPIYSPAPSQPAYPYSQTGYAPSNYTDVRQQKENTILGLRAATFWLLLALAVVIIAAAVGGGVGGSIAVNNAKTSCLQSNACAAIAASQVSASLASASSTATSASSTTSAMTTTAASSSASAIVTKTTAWGPVATTLPFTGCPGNNNTIYTTVISGSKFQIVCGMDIPFTGTSDLLAGITPTFQLCMELCGSWNDIAKSNGNASATCKGVAFIPTHVNGDGGGSPIDCVLKSYATGLIVNPGYVVDSAILL